MSAHGSAFSSKVVALSEHRTAPVKMTTFASRQAIAQKVIMVVGRGNPYVGLRVPIADLPGAAAQGGRAGRELDLRDTRFRTFGTEVATTASHRYAFAGSGSSACRMRTR